MLRLADSIAVMRLTCQYRTEKQVHVARQELLEAIGISRKTSIPAMAIIFLELNAVWDSVRTFRTRLKHDRQADR